jgi:hypothetical protein
MNLFIPLLAGVVMMSSAQAELIATFSQGGEPADKRLDRLAALSVPVGHAATPFLKPGKFEVEWTGGIKIDQRRR